MKKHLITVLKILVTAFLIYYLFQTKGIDLRQSWKYIQSSRIFLLVIGYGLLLAGQFLCSLRWSLILNRLDIRLPLRRLFQFYLIGMFFSLFFPSIVGGDFVKIYYVKKDSGKSIATALASAYLERATGFFALLVYGLAGALFYPLTLTSRDFSPIGWIGLRSVGIWVLPAAALVLFLTANAVLFGPHLYALAVSLLNRLGLHKLAEKVLLIRDAIRVFREHPAALLTPTLISFLNIALVIVMNWLIARALDIHVSLLVMASVVSVMTLLVMLPISINGIGLRENAYVILLQLVGVPPDKSFALSLIGFFLIVLSALPGGVIYSLMKRELPIPPDGQVDAG